MISIRLISKTPKGFSSKKISVAPSQQIIILQAFTNVPLMYIFQGSILNLNNKFEQAGIVDGSIIIGIPSEFVSKCQNSNVLSGILTKISQDAELFGQKLRIREELEKDVKREMLRIKDVSLINLSKTSTRSIRKFEASIQSMNNNMEPSKIPENLSFEDCTSLSPSNDPLPVPW